MSQKINSNGNLIKLSLLLFPVCYLLLGIYFRLSIGEYHTWTVDPEYAYLFNGLNVAQPSLKVWHVDHPGTPFQLFIGGVIRITHLFCGSEGINESVCRNPELYLGIINITTLVLFSTILWWLGRIVYRGSQNILSAIFLQSSPFLSIYLFHAMMRVSIEPALMICSLVLICLVLKFLNGESRKSALFFALVVALGMANKITYAGAFFIPLFVLQERRQKLKYCALTGVFFVFFIAPVLIYRSDYFFGWISKLLTHSGQHGTGQEALVNMHEFSENISAVLFLDVFFTTVIAILFVFLLVVPFLKKTIASALEFKILIGTFISSGVNIVLVTKHFSSHYLVPSFMLLGLQLYLLANLANKKPGRGTTLILATLALALIGFRISEAINIGKHLQKRQAEYKKAETYTETVCKEKKLMIIADDYSCARKEFALSFGVYWSGRDYAREYNMALDKVYPNSYLYAGWDKRFYGWNTDNYSASQLARQYGRVYLYSIKPDLTAGLPEFDSTNNFFQNPSIKKVFENLGTKETIYEIIAPAMAQKRITLKCDAENISTDKLGFSGSNGVGFGNGDTQSSEKARSGRYSSKVSEDSQYGMTRAIKGFNPGDSLLISVWRHKSDHQASLVTSAGTLYYASKTSVGSEGDWEKLSIKIEITSAMAGPEFIIYVWNKGPQPAYFDDLEIALVSPR